MTTLPSPWQRLLEAMREQGRPMSPREVQQALGLSNSPRHRMNRMAAKGLLVRVSPG